MATDCMNQLQSIVAVDVGNSRTKLGRFDRQTPASLGLPEPVETIAVGPSETGSGYEVAPLADWLAEMVAPGTPFFIGSVNRPGTAALQKFLREYDGGHWDNVRELVGGDLPIENRTNKPDRVGIDRLAAAVAACRFRRANTPTIVVDFGTAIKVDLVSNDGAFEGGAILPGVGTSAHALHTSTDVLPVVHLELNRKSPPSLGKDTKQAIEAGLYWGAVGAVRELIARHHDGLVTGPRVLVTGSTSPEMARLLGSPDYTVRYLPHLVMAGLAISAWQA